MTVGPCEKIIGTASAKRPSAGVIETKRDSRKKGRTIHRITAASFAEVKKKVPPG
jgi:hypothetical protein